MKLILSYDVDFTIYSQEGFTQNMLKKIRKRENPISYRISVFQIFLIVLRQRQRRAIYAELHDQIQIFTMYRFIVLSLLLFLLNGLTFNHCPLCNAHMIQVQKAVFDLSLDYAALDKYAPGNAEAKILWNGYEHGVLKPQNRSVNHFTTQLRVVEGPNVLSIIGVNGSTGIIIDNVKLIRQGGTESIVENGDFQKSGTAAQQLQSTFLGWAGHPKSINTKAENKNWPPSTAALILPGAASSLAQSFRFDRENRFETDKFTLYFDYAAQTGAPLQSARGIVSWNTQTFQINPTDYEVHTVKALLKPEQNKINILTFKGVGQPDGLGLTISNVKLIALGSSANMVLNGDFSMPAVSKDTQSVSFLPAWDISTKTVTIGKAQHFNKWWPHSVKQVLTLDNNQNVAVGQQFNIGNKFKYIPREIPFFEVSFDYAASDDESLSNSKGVLLLNNQLIAEFKPEDRKVHHFTQKMSFMPGSNQFTFHSKSGSTVAISNFKVKRLGLKDDIAINGAFTEITHKDIVPGWKGVAKILDSEDFNQNWKSNKVARLSSKHKESISQNFELDKDFRFKTNRYHLQLEMAPTEEADLNEPLAFLSWNGKTFPLIPTSRNVQKFTTEVIAVRGPNLLTLSGQGDDGDGLSVDNVKLIPFGSSTLSIKNGDFQDPEIKGNADFKVFYDIPDWEGYNVEIGFGDNYNPNWPESNDQVLSLATKQKTVIYQVLVLTEMATMGVEEPNAFTLSLDFAAEDGKPLQKTGGEIYWNKKLVGELIPTNYNITQYTLQLQVDSGQNTLYIKAAGGIEAYGLTIDNVKLVRKGSTDNIIDNGDFEAPGSGGWKSIIHDAPLFNHMWAKTKVGKLDPNRNLTLTKIFYFDSFYRFETDKLYLMVDYAAKQGTSLSTARGSCTWNNHVEKFEPRDYKVQRVKIPVQASQGENILKFEGEGLTIDNVRLVPLGSVSNILLNGDFEIPVVGQAINNAIPSGWKGQSSIEFGTGYLFSRQWGYGSSQVVSLTKRHNYLSQIVTIDSTRAVVRPQFPFFDLSFDYVAVEDGEETIGEVYWNNRLVGSLRDEEDLNHFLIRVDVQSGVNTLTLKRKNQGAAISNIKLNRYGLNENIVKNGDFRAPLQGSNIPQWKGQATLDDSEQYQEDWQGQKVVVLDEDSEGSISQEFNFDGNLRYITDDYVISFQYGVRQGVRFESAKAIVYWNYDLFRFYEKDHNLHAFKKVVKARKGNNNLIFRSDGEKRTFGKFAEGFDIDNVMVRPYGSAKNVLKNHDFDEPKIVNFQFGMFTTKVPGWITNQIYIGKGHYFGPEWGWTQIIELAGLKTDAQIMQVVKVGDNWHLEQ